MLSGYNENKYSIKRIKSTKIDQNKKILSKFVICLRYKEFGEHYVNRWTW